MQLNFCLFQGVHMKNHKLFSIKDNMIDFKIILFYFFNYQNFYPES